MIAQPTTATPTCPPAAFEPPEPFNLSCDVQPITPVSTPALEDPMFEVIVSVTYPAINPPGSTATTTHHARIRSRNRVYTLN